MDEDIQKALNLSEQPEVEPLPEKLETGVKSRYPVLSLVAAIYRVAGWILVAFSVISLFVGFVMFGGGDRDWPIFFLFALIIGPLTSLSCFFIAESMMVLTHIEENTRATSLLLKEIQNNNKL